MIRFMKAVHGRLFSLATKHALLPSMPENHTATCSVLRVTDLGSNPGRPPVAPSSTGSGPPPSILHPRLYIELYKPPALHRITTPSALLVPFASTA